MPTLTLTDPADGAQVPVTVDKMPSPGDIDTIAKNVFAARANQRNIAKSQADIANDETNNPWVKPVTNRGFIGNIAANIGPSTVNVIQGAIDAFNPANNTPSPEDMAAAQQKVTVDQAARSMYNSDYADPATLPKEPDTPARQPRGIETLNPIIPIVGDDSMIGHGVAAAQQGPGAFAQFLKTAPAGILNETQTNPAGQILNIVALVEGGKLSADVGARGLGAFAADMDAKSASAAAAGDTASASSFSAAADHARAASNHLQAIAHPLEPTMRAVAKVAGSTDEGRALATRGQELLGGGASVDNEPIPTTGESAPITVPVTNEPVPGSNGTRPKPSPRQLPQATIGETAQVAAPVDVAQSAPISDTPIPSEPVKNGAKIDTENVKPNGTGLLKSEPETPTPAPVGSVPQNLPTVGDFFNDESGALNLQPFVNAVHATAQAVGDVRFRSTGGPFRSTNALDPASADAMMKLASSKESAEGYAKMQDKYVRGSLNPQQQDLLNRYFDDQRARAFDLAGVKYNTVAIPKLTPTEAAQIANDPAIQDAIAKHRTGPQVYIERLRQYVSPQMRKPGGLVKTPDNAFLSLLPTKDAAGKDINPGAGPGGALPAVNTRLSGTRFAKQATGTGQEYNPDYGARLQKSVVEVTQKANKRNVVKTLLAARDAAGNKLAHTAIETTAEQDPTTGNMVVVKQQRTLPTTIKYNGVDWRAKEIDTGITQRWNYKRPDGTPGVKEVRLKVAVPEQVADDFDRAINPSSNKLDEKFGAGIHGAIQKYGDVATGLALASPTEALNHIGRLLSVAGSIPDIKAGLIARGIQAVAPQPYMFYKILSTDMSSLANLNTLQRINESGGGSIRPFQQQVDSGLVSHVPVLKQLAHYQHELLFGMPEGKGLKSFLKHGGFDARLRVAMENLRSSIEGNTNPRRTGEFLRQFGQYGSARDPWINAIRPLNPYAATTFPVRLTELRQMFGDTGLKAPTHSQANMIRANTIANRIVAAFVVHYMLNKLLSGQWPTENENGHMYDIAIKAPDGSIRYVPYRIVNPAEERPLKMLGLTDDAEDMRSGDLTPGGAVNNLGRGLRNAAGSAVNSPAATAATTLWNGRSPFYITRKGEELKTAPDPNDPTSRALAALANTNNVTGMVMQYLANRSGR